jgi:protein-disulfide isomerase
MKKSTKQLYLIIGALIIIVSILLWKEIKNYQSIITRASNEPLIAETATPLKISPKYLVLGNPGANNSIVEYLDLNDEKSLKIHQTIAEFILKDKNALKINLFFKHAPVPGLFGNNTLPNKAAYCAASQDKLIDFISAINKNKNNLKEAGLRSAAVAANLKINSWWECTNNGEALAAVQSDLEEARKLNLGEPPLIFLNNKKLNTNQDFNMTELLTALIAE